jgi:hypothetical protein
MPKFNEFQKAAIRAYHNDEAKGRSLATLRALTLSDLCAAQSGAPFFSLERDKPG